MGDGANACEVTVEVPPTPGNFGEQAGLFWYFDDDNYVKLVMEWMQDGNASIVLARESQADGGPEVAASITLDEEEVQQPLRLRFEVSPDGLKLSGVLVGAYYMRLIGSCSAVFPDLPATPSVGFSAHGAASESCGER